MKKSAIGTVVMILSIVFGVLALCVGVLFCAIGFEAGFSSDMIIMLSAILIVLAIFLTFGMLVMCKMLNSIEDIRMMLYQASHRHASEYVDDEAEEQ